MSAKKIIGAALTVVGIALIATGIGAPLGTIALGAGLGSISVAAVLGTGLLLASSMLLGPSLPKPLSTSPISRLYANLDTTTPRKIVFGDTAGATDVRYQSYTGADQEYYEQVIAVASHFVDGIYEIWIDNEKAWTSAGGVQGRFVGYLTVNVRNAAWSDNGIAIDATWTTSCTLTGCAYVRLRFKLTGPDESTPSPFQGGVTNRLTIRTRGAKVYDPRLDSTVTGGSGSQRANDQSTWAWSSSASRNPALQLLWYLLGWRLHGTTKLMLGMGIPPARIDLASFITAANICDESVALAAGGTEPRYRSDGVLSEGDDRRAVKDALCVSMNAELRDHGGKIAIQVFFNDLATVAADFTENDIHGDEEWDQTPPLADYFNICRGRCVDPSDNALYQLTDIPEKKVASPDGIDRIQTLDLPMVQSITQGQRLLKLRLMRNQYQGRYSATYGPRAWAASVGKIVRQTHPGLSWTNKLFRTAAQAISRTGQVRQTLLEESSAIYVWSTADEGTALVAGTPPVADPSKNPVLPGAAALTSLIKGSSVVPSNVLTIHSTGLVDVAAHTRVYDDKSLAVSGTTGLASGGSSGQVVAVYYDDQTRADTTPPYATIVASGGVPSSAFASSAHPYRHFVGSGTIPASGSGSGTGPTPPGGGGGTVSV